MANMGTWERMANSFAAHGDICNGFMKSTALHVHLGTASLLLERLAVGAAHVVDMGAAHVHNMRRSENNLMRACTLRPVALKRPYNRSPQNATKNLA
eukprot:350357-Chlamydomonas_euryale.AAC.4